MNKLFSLSIVLLFGTSFSSPDSTGADCFLCHDVGGSSGIVHRLGGTVYTDNEGTTPAKEITITLIDIAGNTITLSESNEYGNFWASPSEVKKSRYLMKVNNFRSRLWHEIPKWGDCNLCHIPGGNGIPDETIEMPSDPNNCHTPAPISNNCQQCHYDPSPYAPEDVHTIGTLDANKPGVIMPDKSEFDIDGQTYNFDPLEHTIKAKRQDVFADGYFSAFDVILALCEKNNIKVVYEYDEEAKCHFITSINGKKDDYWYQLNYHNNEFEYYSDLIEEIPYRWDEILWKPGTKCIVNTKSPPRQTFTEGAARDGDGFTTVPTVLIDGNSFSNVKVTPHDFLAEGSIQPHLKPFKKGVITTLDVLLSLQDQGEINNVRTTYYEFVNYACVKSTKFPYETGAYVGAYFVTRINNYNHRGHNGWFFCHSTQKGVKHVTADIGVIHGISVVNWYPSQNMGSAVERIFDIDAPEYYWEEGSEKYTPGDTTDFVTAINNGKEQDKKKKIDDNKKKEVLADLMKRGFMLNTPVPNPFSTTCRIQYAVYDKGSKPQKISIAIYNMIGTKIVTLHEGLSMPGVYDLVWNPGKTASGRYIIIMTFGKNQQSRRILYLNKSTD